MLKLYYPKEYIVLYYPPILISYMDTQLKILFDRTLVTVVKLLIRKILTLYIILFFNIRSLTLKTLYTYEYTIEISIHKHIVNINEIRLYFLISNSLK